MPVPEICRELGISSTTFYKWRAKFGGMDTSMMARMKELEDENHRLKKMYLEEKLKAEIANEYLAKKLARPYRRREITKALGLKPVTTPVASPQSNGMAESFVKTLKQDYAKMANWPGSKTVIAQLKDWFADYNSYHPHSALGYLPPILFREKRSVT